MGSASSLVLEQNAGRPVFVDTETTGLDPERHEIWEVGLITSDQDGVPQEHLWHLPVDVGRADPMALAMNGFLDRYPHHDLRSWWGDAEKILHDFAVEFMVLTEGAFLVGAVVSFDAERLWRLLRRHAGCPLWHYHIIDVEALGAGALRERAINLAIEGKEDTANLFRRTATPPWNSDELSTLLGVRPDQFDRHSALGDARWARAIYDEVLGL